MSLDLIQEIFANIFSSGRVGKHLDIAWHAGEPFTLPPSYYKDAFHIIDELKPIDTQVTHVFQTNGVLLSTEWCSLLKDSKSVVGISLDGPAHIHDASRIDRRGRGTFQSVLRGVSILQAHDLNFHVIAVLTKESLSQPQALFDFFLNLGIRQVCFNFEEIDGTHTTSSLAFEDVNLKAREFLTSYYLANQAAGFPQWIREIDGALNGILLSDLQRPVNSLVTPFRSINVDIDGNFSTFCPELLSYRGAHYGSFVLGNLRRDSLNEASNTEHFQRINNDIQLGVSRCRASCDYFGICGGGAPSNKLYENDDLTSTETMHCRLAVKAVTDVVLEIVSRRLTMAGSSVEEGLREKGLPV